MAGQYSVTVFSAIVGVTRVYNVEITDVVSNQRARYVVNTPAIFGSFIPVPDQVSGPTRFVTQTNIPVNQFGGAATVRVPGGILGPLVGATLEIRTSSGQVVIPVMGGNINFTAMPSRFQMKLLETRTPPSPRQRP